MDFDDGRVDADEDFGFVQIRDVAAGENGGGAFGVGDQGGDQLLQQDLLPLLLQALFFLL